MITQELNKIYFKKKINLKENVVFSYWATKGIRKSRDFFYDLYNRKSYNKILIQLFMIMSYSKIFKKVLIGTFLSSPNLLATELLILKIRSRLVGILIIQKLAKLVKRSQAFGLSWIMSLLKTFLIPFSSTIAVATTRHLESSSTVAQNFFEINFNKNVPIFCFRQIT